MISYLQAVVIGLLQGVTELFPVSSLGHSVLVPAFIGGSWETLVTQSATSTSESSPYLAIIVALHVATALALIVFFRSDWVRIIRGFGRTVGPSIAARRIVATDADERLAWLLVIATIPVGVTGLALEHTFRTLFAKPLAAAIFLTINGLILLAGEGLRRRAPVDAHNGDDTQATPAPQPTTHTTNPTVEVNPAPARRLATLRYGEAAIIGFFQTFALLAGISRSGIAMVGGLARVCLTATPRASPSCSPPRSSWPPFCSSCPPWPARPVPTSMDKFSSAPPSPDWRPMCPSNGSPATSRPAR